MKKKDLLLIAALLLIAGGLYAVSQMAFGGQANAVVVTVDGQERLRKPLTIAGEYEITTEDGGVNVIVVGNGSVYMKSANCRDGLCMTQGRVANAAKTIVCLPHKLVVQLEKGEMTTPEDDELDVIVR